MSRPSSIPRHRKRNHGTKCGRSRSIAQRHCDPDRLKIGTQKRNPVAKLRATGFAMLPVEKNARRLIGVIVQYFPLGGTTEEMRRQFEETTSLARQSFYNALKHTKKQNWLIKDRHQYILNPDGSWKRPFVSTGDPVGEPLSRDQLEYLADTRAQQVSELQGEVERLRDWSNGSDVDGIGVAIPALIRIISDSSSTMRQRIKAASTILNYQVQDSEVTTFVRGFLESVCTNTDVATDHKLEALEQLRRHEAPRVAPETVRPAYDDNDNAEPPIPLKELVRQRRERADRMEREEIERRLGLQPGGAADIPNPTEYLLQLRRSHMLPSDINSMQPACNLENKDTQDQ